ncbi:unnamed protein product [Amoebophrya sp. A25]|nr:unnamed protein product [Amoebophrya sp. A25]|eukprot:GSA25T00016525001.1
MAPSPGPAALLWQQYTHLAQHQGKRRLVSTTGSPSTSFLLKESCDPAGSLVRSTVRGPSGKADVDYSLCYAPSAPQDSLQNLKCEPGSFRARSRKLHCCKDAEFIPQGRTKGGTSKSTAKTFCADALADYADGKLAYRSGTTCEPAESRDTAWGGWFFRKGCAGNDKDFLQPVSIHAEDCRGEVGTMIVHRETPGEHHFEFCPAGTAPIEGPDTTPDVSMATKPSLMTRMRSMFSGVKPTIPKKRPWHSWQCGSKETKLIDEYCCSLSGRERCVASYIDATEVGDHDACQCNMNQTPANVGRFL